MSASFRPVYSESLTHIGVPAMYSAVTGIHRLHSLSIVELSCIPYFSGVRVPWNV